MALEFLVITPHRVLLLGVLLSVVGCGAARRPPTLLPASPPIPAKALRLISTAPPPAGERLDPSVIRRDLQHLAVALDEAYAGRGLVTPESFQRILSYLTQIASEARTPAELCEEIAQHLWQLRQPKLRVTDASGAPCGPYRGLNPSTAVPPRGDEAPWTLETRSTSGGPVALLTVYRLDAMDPEAGKRLMETLGTLATPNALVIDLRSASGSTAEGGMWLARQVSGLPELWPVRGVASKQNAFTEVLHLNAAAQAASAEAPPWLRPPGAAAPASSTLAAYAGDVRILTGETCLEACVLTALALLSHSRAEVIGDFHVGWAQLAHPGLLVLPRSGIRIEIPTTVIDLGKVSSLKKGSLEGTVDPVEYTLQSLGVLLNARSRMARWKDQEPPPLCPEGAPSRSLDELSSQERSRIDFRLQRALERMRPDKRGSIFISLSVDVEKAQQLLAACPGVTAVDLGVQTPSGESLLTITATRDALLRLAASDVVVRMEGGGQLGLE